MQEYLILKNKKEQNQIIFSFALALFFTQKEMIILNAAILPQSLHLQNLRYQAHRH